MMICECGHPKTKHLPQFTREPCQVPHCRCTQFREQDETPQTSVDDTPISFPSYDTPSYEAPTYDPPAPDPAPDFGGGGGFDGGGSSDTF